MSFCESSLSYIAFGIRFDKLVGEFQDIIQSVRKDIGDHQFPKFMCIAWAVWRSRNEAMYEGKKQSIRVCQSYWERALEDSTILACGTGLLTKEIGMDQSGCTGVQQEHGEQGLYCYVDGSWDQSGRAGVGVVLVRDGTVLKMEQWSVHAINATHAEAIAICKGLQIVAKQPGEGGTVYSDYLELVNALSQGLPVIPDWRVNEEMWEAWRIQKEASGTVRTLHKSRQDGCIGVAHRLANESRLVGTNVQGDVSTMYLLEI